MCNYVYRKTLVVPYVDALDWNTLEHRLVYQQGKLYKGIFEWGFLYKEMQMSLNDVNKRKYTTEPYWYLTNFIWLFPIKYLFIKKFLKCILLRTLWSSLFSILMMRKDLNYFKIKHTF